MDAQLPSGARQTYHHAYGYIVASQDADLADTADSTLMCTTAHRARNDALRCLQAKKMKTDS